MQDQNDIVFEDDKEDFSCQIFDYSGSIELYLNEYLSNAINIFEEIDTDVISKNILENNDAEISYI